MGAAFHRVQVLLLRIAIVEELGVDALLMSRALLDEAMAQPHQSPYLLDVIGWYPRLRKPVNYHKIPQVPGVKAIGLGPLVAPLQGLGLRRLGQVRLDSGTLHLLEDVAPAGCSL